MADLTAASIGDATFTKSNLTGANLSGETCRSTTLRGETGTTIFDGAVFTEANLWFLRNFADQGWETQPHYDLVGVCDTSLLDETLAWHHFAA
jgi:uncharacterized protein YjbI with pentapeptide repeats